jgi:hypothetical protein
MKGTNRFACVCRQWRDAEDSKDSKEADAVKLFADLRHMSNEDISRVFSWMAAHGQQAESLVLRASIQQQPLPLDLFSMAAPSLSSLTWLEVDQRHSLVLLAPVLGQLPQLKHLAAEVDLWDVGSPRDSPILHYDFDGPSAGMFYNHLGEEWVGLPDMQLLCPQLVHFVLRVNALCIRVMMDERLPQLLPTRLQQLTLAAEWDSGVYLEAHSLQHLAALQRLALDGVEMSRADRQAVMQSSSGLQQVQVYSMNACNYMASVWESAPKLTGYMRYAGRALGAVSQLVHLSTLMLTGCENMPEGTVEALSTLTGLRALTLEGGLLGTMSNGSRVHARPHVLCTPIPQLPAYWYSASRVALW